MPGEFTASRQQAILKKFLVLPPNSYRSLTSDLPFLERGGGGDSVRARNYLLIL